MKKDYDSTRIYRNTHKKRVRHRLMNTLFIFSSNLNTQPSLISIVSPLGNKTNEMWTPTTRKIGEDVDSTYWWIPDLHIKA